MIVSHSFLLRMRNVSEEIHRENQNALFLFINSLLSKIVPLVG
jgi:hypothetical protein